MFIIRANGQKLDIATPTEHEKALQNLATQEREYGFVKNTIALTFALPGNNANENRKKLEAIQKAIEENLKVLRNAVSDTDKEGLSRLQEASKKAFSSLGRSINTALKTAVTVSSSAKTTATKIQENVQEKQQIQKRNRLFLYAGGALFLYLIVRK